MKNEVLCNICLDKCLQLSDVSENSNVKTGLPEEGADEGRNASKHQLNNEIGEWEVVH